MKENLNEKHMNRYHIKAFMNQKIYLRPVWKKSYRKARWKRAVMRRICRTTYDDILR